MEFYLSNLIGNVIINKSGEKIGTVTDLVVTRIELDHPRVVGLVMKRGIKKDLVFIPAHDITNTSAQKIKLSTDLVDLTPFTLRENEVLLAKDVYDKQIVDIDDRRLTRINDLLLYEDQSKLVLSGVDVSSLGVLSRLNIPTFGLLRRNVVDWGDVQFLSGDAPVKFKVQYKNLESLHPVDIARIIFEGPGYKQGSRVLSQLKDPIAADIIEELSPKLQRNLIESMKTEDVADVISHMPSHKAADLLVAIGSVYTQKVLPFLEKDQADEITQLLKYPETSTGAFMTTDYIAIPKGITLEETTQRIRKLEELPDFMLYMYALDNEFSNKLVGVLSIYDIFSADLRSRVESVMVKNIITSYPYDPIKDSLKKMFRYNISAIPVVSQKERRLLGIVTFRDAISIYLPRRWKSINSRLFTNNT